MTYRITIKVGSKTQRKIGPIITLARLLFGKQMVNVEEVAE